MFADEMADLDCTIDYIRGNLPCSSVGWKQECSWISVVTPCLHSAELQQLENNTLENYHWVSDKYQGGTIGASQRRYLSEALYSIGIKYQHWQRAGLRVSRFVGNRREMAVISLLKFVHILPSDECRKFATEICGIYSRLSPPILCIWRDTIQKYQYH